MKSGVTSSLPGRTQTALSTSPSTVKSVPQSVPLSVPLSVPVSAVRRSSAAYFDLGSHTANTSLRSASDVVIDDLEAPRPGPDEVTKDSAVVSVKEKTVSIASRLMVETRTTVTTTTKHDDNRKVSQSFTRRLAFPDNTEDTKMAGIDSEYNKVAKVITCVILVIVIGIIVTVVITNVT